MSENTIQIIMLVVTVLVGAAAVYFKSNTKLAKRVADYIAMAEEEYKDVTKAGGLKFQWCVEKLYALVPAAFKPFITKEGIGRLVQSVFDSVAKYARLQLDKMIKS